LKNQLKQIVSFEEPVKKLQKCLENQTAHLSKITKEMGELSLQDGLKLGKIYQQVISLEE
jgi:hypothetical protein